MGLKDDLEIQKRHIERGTLREYMRGETDPLPEPEAPIDRSAKPGIPLVYWLAARGE